MTKYTLDFARNLAAQKGGKCLSDLCLGIKTRVLWQCSQGHEWKTSLDNVVHNKTWCRVCANKTNGKAQRSNNIASARKIAANHGGKCLETSNFPVRNKKVRWECSKGHQWSAIFHNIRNGVAWCPKCAGVIKHTIEDVKNLAHRNGGEYISGVYKSNKTKLTWRCGKGHEWQASFNSINHLGSWCPRCINKTEVLCGEVLMELLPNSKFIKTRALEWLKVGKSNYPLELDFYSEELSLAFEYDGRQHSEVVPFFHKNENDLRNQIKRDKLKESLCDDNDVTLIRISYKVIYGKKTKRAKKKALRTFIHSELIELGYLSA